MSGYPKHPEAFAVTIALGLKPTMTGQRFDPPEISPSYAVGYCRPPKRTQWQKGQCGNPNRIRKRTPKPVVEMIDDFFASEIAISEQGLSRRVRTFEAILLQLLRQALTGGKRAVNVLLQYHAYALRRGGMGDQRVEVVMEDASPRTRGDDK
jgi:Family of unknown function (DUF5681)